MRGVRFALSLLPLLFLGIVAPVVAQVYPAKPIRLVNPLGSGGTAEALARTIATQLSQQLGQPVVLETKTGAAGTIGVEYAAKSTPDGYTLLYGVTGANTIAPALYRKLPYDPENDLAPISMAVLGPNVLVVQAGLNISSVQDLIAQARSKAGPFSFASAGTGSMSHLNGEMFKVQTGIDLLHVPYKGGGAAVPDLLSGRVNMMFETSAGVAPLIRSGKLRALAVTTRERWSQLPDVPTFAEVGLPEMSSTVWGALFAPAGTPRAILERISEELSRAKSNAAYREQLAALNNEPVSMTPDEFKSFVHQEIQRYGELLRRAGVKPE